LPGSNGLDARELYRFYPAGDEEVVALRGVSLRVDPGEMVAVVGPSGSGKSTLLQCIAGLDEPDGGTVIVGGERMTRQPEWERARLRARHIGVVFQYANLLEHLTVAANIMVAAHLARVSPAVGSLLAAVGLEGMGRAYPSRLSGGEAVRAAVAVALAGDPDVVLADEPTGEIDSSAEQLVLDLLRSRAAAGAAMVIVTHSPVVAGAADRVVRLHDGRVLD
jgi:putative ABC transport system ATP-binding protein